MSDRSAIEADLDFHTVEFSSPELAELRKFLSITMTKLEEKVSATTPGSRPNRTAAESYRALKAVYEEVVAAIEKVAGL